jgi:hypothetical protein
VLVDALIYLTLNCSLFYIDTFHFLVSGTHISVCAATAEAPDERVVRVAAATPQAAMHGASLVHQVVLASRQSQQLRF